MSNQTSQQIRTVQPSDTTQLVEIFSHYVRTSPATLDTKEPSANEFDQKINDVQRFGGPFLVLEENDKEIIGFAYAGCFRPKDGYNSSVEITIYLHPEYTGKGLAKPLLSELLKQCRERGYKLAISVITVDPNIGAMNMPSGKFHLAMGFQYNGTIQTVAQKFERFWDTATFSIDLCPKRTKPSLLWHDLSSMA